VIVRAWPHNRGFKVSEMRLAGPGARPGSARKSAKKTAFMHVDVFLPQLPNMTEAEPKEGNRLSRKPKLGTLDFSTARLLLVCVSIFAVLIGMPCSSRSQTPTGDVAAQVRSQGYACDEPVTAKRDVRLSKPDLAVWILNCRNATYRVRLHPDMAAHVIKLKHYH